MPREELAMLIFRRLAVYTRFRFFLTAEFAEIAEGYDDY
jgi:hypothetical protein